jgi:hypothetical protein
LRMETRGQGLERGDPRTYGTMAPADTYGLAPTPAVFSVEMVRNRQDPRVVAALALLLGTEDLLVSQDRWCECTDHRTAYTHLSGQEVGWWDALMARGGDRIAGVYRPTCGLGSTDKHSPGSTDKHSPGSTDKQSPGSTDKQIPGSARCDAPPRVSPASATTRPPRDTRSHTDDEEEEAEGSSVERPEWRTRRNLHLDLHPWNYLAGATAIDELGFEGTRDFSREINLVCERGAPHLQGLLCLLDNRGEHDKLAPLPRSTDKNCPPPPLN